jgi:hypothetical protein
MMNGIKVEGISLGLFEVDISAFICIKMMKSSEEI